MESLVDVMNINLKGLSRKKKQQNFVTPLGRALGLCIISMGFPCSSVGKESACNAGGLGSIPGLERSPGEGKGFPLQYSVLENSMDMYSPWGHKESDMT